MSLSSKSYELLNSADKSADEISLKEVIIRFKRLWRYLFLKKTIILIAFVIGALIGVCYAYYKVPVYKAELTFSLQDEKGGGGLSSALGLANQFGLDIGGGSAGGEFSGDNLLLLLRSRSMVEKTLLSSVTINGRAQTLAELYINANGIREKWTKKADLANINFLPDANRSKFSLKQDSVLGDFYEALKTTDFTATKLEKSSGIYSINVKSRSELFAKMFTEVLAKVVSDYYIQTKTEKSLRNVKVLQRQTDSVRIELNSAISGVAVYADANPNANPSRQTLRVPSQRRQIDVQANTAILNELVKNLELSKMSLLQATPLIQIIDRPILPLEKNKLGKVKGLILGGILGAFLMIFALVLRKIYKSLIYQ